MATNIPRNVYGNRLVIGTAQLGFDYGFAVKSKKIRKHEFRSMLDLCADNNICVIDTASAYGDCHQTLSELAIEDFDIITKLSVSSLQKGDTIRDINGSIETILRELDVQKIHALLIHDVASLKGISGMQVWHAIQDLKHAGLIENVGASIYSPEDLGPFKQDIFADIIQAPFNIFDRRILESGWLDILHNRGTKIHARSVFLQGVLLQDFSKLHSYFNNWKLYFDDFEKFCERNDLTKLEVLINYVLSFDKIDKVIVGAEDFVQLKQIIGACKKINYDWKMLQTNCRDEGLLNPLNWDLS